MAYIEDHRNLLLLADAGTYVEEQQPIHATPHDNPPHDDEQPAHASPYHGFTAINSAAATGGLAPNSLPQPPHSTRASAGPPQRVTKRRAAPRTTGFNKETGSGLLTDACARVTPSKGTPVRHRSKAGGAFRCPRCQGRFTKPRSVKDHFIKCVDKYGNPAGLSWFDDPSLAKSKDWLLQHKPKREEEEDEEDEDVEMQEGDDDE